MGSSVPVRRHGQLKKRAQGDDGSWQKFAAARGLLTRHAVPAPCKKHGHKGRGGTFSNRMKDRGIKQRLHLRSERTLFLRNKLDMMIFFNLLGAWDIFRIAESSTVVIPVISQRYAKLLYVVEMQGDWQCMLGMILAIEFQKFWRI
jgi:hypothetical protein